MVVEVNGGLSAVTSCNPRAAVVVGSIGFSLGVGVCEELPDCGSCFVG